MKKCSKFNLDVSDFLLCPADWVSVHDRGGRWLSGAGGLIGQTGGGSCSPGVQ